MLTGLVSVSRTVVGRLSRSKGLATTLVGLLAVTAVLLDLRWTTSLILGVLVIVVAVARLDYRLRPWQLGLAGSAIVVLVGGGLVYARSHANNRPASAVIEDVVLQMTSNWRNPQLSSRLWNSALQL